MNRSYLVTPEGIPLDVDVAGLGSRMIAALIDFMIQLGLGVLLGIALAFFSASGGTADVILILVLLGTFLILFGYFPVCEGIWNGRTPGKASQKLRVIQTNGQPLSMGPMLVRNLVRIVDFLPAWYALGAVVMIISGKSQRLGDMAAGTIVVRERKAPVPSAMLGRDERSEVHRLDTTRLTERDYGMIRSFLERRNALTATARLSIANEIAQTVASKVGGDVKSFQNQEELLEAIAASYRHRFAR